MIVDAWICSDRLAIEPPFGNYQRVATSREIRPPQELVSRVAADAGDPQGFLRALQNLVALRQEDDVLDVGCGVGRVAIGLTTYLTGRYEGFDVDPELVAWCQENISPRYPNFRFTHVNVFNGTYNPQGAPARESVFPYPDASFDLIVGFSIFTHLLPEDANHYLSESRRVLRRGGRLLFTFFLLGPKTRATLSRGGTIADALLERYDGDFATAYEQPEELVAYRQGYIREACERLGFEVTSIRHGNWPDWAIDQRADCTQDVVLASLPDRAP